MLTHFLNARNFVHPLSFAAAALTVAALTMPTAPADAQHATGGRGRGGRSDPRTRIEATSDIRWDHAPFDPSHGAQTYWIHISADGGHGKTTGGFTLTMQPRMMGVIKTIDINGIPIGKPGSNTPPTPGHPTRAKLTGSCEYGGTRYRVVIELVADDYHPATTPGGRGGSLPGSIRMKLTDLATKAISTAATTKRPSVRIWLR